MDSEDYFALVGQTIDNTYVVHRQIGEGGFGVVYRAEDTGLEVPVAIKCLKIPGHFTPEVRTQFYKKFHEEAKLLAKLSEHPGIVRVYKFGQVPTPMHGPVPYLALEWLNGTDLERLLQKRKAAGMPPFSESEAIALMLPVIDAIAYAHRRNVAHRDLKPANIFVTESEGKTRLRVLDFGIAKVMQEGDSATQMSTKTRSGFSAFSPQYGAPEQFHSKQYGATGPWTDVHALGLIFNDLLAGRTGLGDDAMECALVSIGDDRPTPRRFGVVTSDAIEAILHQALARSPKDRFANADAFQLALSQLALATSAAGFVGYSTGTDLAGRQSFVPAYAALTPPPAQGSNPPHALMPAQGSNPPHALTPAVAQSAASFGKSGTVAAAPLQTTAAPSIHPDSADVYPKKFNPVVIGAIGAGAIAIAGVVGLAVWHSHSTPSREASSSSQDLTTESPNKPARISNSTSDSLGESPTANAPTPATADRNVTALSSASKSTGVGTLTVTASQLAVCAVDGIARGRTPITVRIAPGDHLVACSAGALKASETVSVVADKSSAIQLQLAAATGASPPTPVPPPTATKPPGHVCDPVMENCH